MVGVCASLGDDPAFVDDLSPQLEVFGTESTGRVLDGDVGVASVYHTADTGGSPATTDEGYVWAWGDVAGFDHPSGYVPRSASETDSLAEYCAELYAEYGPEFVRWLNGRFAIVTLNESAGTVTFATDRLGTMPLYYARAGGTLILSTAVQSLTTYPDWTPSFDSDALGTYFTHQLTPGTGTPFEGVERMSPASTLTVDLNDLGLERECYWTPTYRPVDRPASYFANRLATLLSRAIAERTTDGTEYGLFLSGGGDSRVVLAAMDRKPATYHLNDWQNAEARTAERVARTAGAPFELLLRDRDYYPDLLEGNAALSNFVGTFHEGHAMGFAEQIRDDVDALVTGHMSDSMFSGHHLPSRSCRLGPLGRLSLPFVEPTRTIEEYVSRKRRPTPAYYRGAEDSGTLLRRNLAVTGDGVESHGVAYRSVQDLVRFGSYYPHANAPVFFQQTLDQILPFHNPFLDTRLIDLHLTVPRRVRLRRNLIGRALKRLDPQLARIPHAERRTPLSAPFPVQYAGEIATSVLEEQNVLRTPSSYQTSGPWPKHDELIRSHGFVREAIEECADVIRAVPFLDREGIEETYAAHVNGENRRNELYSLVTFLRAPATRRVVANARPKPRL
ncbi:asparagine synthase-related protein [Halomarina halobia]|uniref:Asparagine synthase-related protein n=1 Tax=Halomarina halobia TaxID=3033386 RepID=A0ABD6AE44_9EURY|nr:asparagine synthase-related protein [Halomarina sp. PSR21]